MFAKKRKDEFEMNVRTKVVITEFRHYNMEGNRGLSAIVVGDYQENNNRFGIPSSEASILNPEELNYAMQYKKELPASFEADLSFVTKKASNGKEVPIMALANLKFIESLELQPKKTATLK